MSSNEQHILIFSYQQLLDVISQTNKKPDYKNKIHFSFTITDKKVYETRD